MSAKQRFLQQQKQDLLDQLDNLRVMHGLGKKHDYTLKSNIRSIRFQVERMLQLKDQKENTAFMHDIIKFGCFALEILLSKLGIKNLDGWSEEVASQKKRLKPILIKLYHRWFKRGSIANPYWELAMALGGSAVMFAFHGGSKSKKERFESGMRRRSRRNKRGRSSVHQDRNVDTDEFNFSDFEEDEGTGNGGTEGDDTDSDSDDMPEPAGGIGGMPNLGAMMGGGGGGLMSMMGSMMGMGK